MEDGMIGCSQCPRLRELDLRADFSVYLKICGSAGTFPWFDPTKCEQRTLVIPLVAPLFSQAQWCTRIRSDKRPVVWPTNPVTQEQMNEYTQKEAVQSGTPSFNCKHNIGFDAKRTWSFASQMVFKVTPGRRWYIVPGVTFSNCR